MIWKCERNKCEIQALFDEVDSTFIKWQRQERAIREENDQRFKELKEQLEADADRSILSSVSSMCASTFGRSSDKYNTRQDQVLLEWVGYIKRFDWKALLHIHSFQIFQEVCFISMYVAGKQRWTIYFRGSRWQERSPTSRRLQ